MKVVVNIFSFSCIAIFREARFPSWYGLVRSNFQGCSFPFLVRRYVAFPHSLTARKRGCNRNIGFSC